MDTLTTPGVEVANEEGPTDTGSIGWVPATMEAMGKIGLPSSSATVAALGDGGMVMISGAARGA